MGVGRGLFISKNKIISHFESTIRSLKPYAGLYERFSLFLSFGTELFRGDFVLISDLQLTKLKYNYDSKRVRMKNPKTNLRFPYYYM